MHKTVLICVIANVSYLIHNENLFGKYSIPKAHIVYKRRLLREYYFSVKRKNSQISELTGLPSNLSHYHTRTAQVWKVPRFRTNYGCQMISNNLPTLFHFHDMSD